MLALIVNFKWNACKNWTLSLKLVVILAQCRYTKIAQRIFKYGDIQYTSLTPDKILNSLVYRTLFYVNICGSYKLLKNSPVFWPTLYKLHKTHVFIVVQSPSIYSIYVNITGASWSNNYLNCSKYGTDDCKHQKRVDLKHSQINVYTQKQRYRKVLFCVLLHSEVLCMSDRCMVWFSLYTRQQ